MEKKSNERLFGSLTVCRRAGRLAFGFDSTKDSIAEGKAKLVLLSEDASVKTEKEIRFFADRAEVPVMRTDAGMAEFDFYLGKKCAVIAVCDDGFAGAIADRLTSPIVDSDMGV
ncbi:MAG: ribosomal L7Ae/L30e/S12e/Gadd45 family protein [Oscillospiraceae bacterium]|nr:ribosomal L7Ae/L30e/S12e/Gadd45 family protein [Oscillospiraceae bacterium]